MANKHTAEEFTLKTPAGEFIAIWKNGHVHGSKFIDPTTGIVLKLGDAGDQAVNQFIQASTLSEQVSDEAVKIHQYLATMPLAIKALGNNALVNPALAPYWQELNVALKTSEDMQHLKLFLQRGLEQLAQQLLASHGTERHHAAPSYVELPNLKHSH